MDFIPADASPETIQNAALACEKVKQFTAGKTIKKVVLVAKKLVNIVAA